MEPAILSSVTAYPVEAFALRMPRRSDGPAIRALIESCRPLDVNSTYAYLLMCTHHAQSCVIAERANALVGFLSAYRLPENPECMFVWQVAVAAEARGDGVAMSMLEELMRRPLATGCTLLQTTVSPDNAASMSLFEAFARHRDTAVTESPGFDSDDFGAETHAAERLLSIPLARDWTVKQKMQIGGKA